MSRKKLLCLKTKPAYLNTTKYNLNFPKKQQKTFKKKTSTLYIVFTQKQYKNHIKHLINTQKVVTNQDVTIK